MNSSRFSSSLEQAEERLKADASAQNLGIRTRQDIVDIVSAISAFEGGEPSEFYRTERAKFISGEIGVDELHDRVVAYWSRQAL